MQLRTTLLKNIIKTSFLFLSITTLAQDKIDGVAVVVGKNIVLDSDMERFKLDLKTQGGQNVNISDCEMLEELMKQKLLAHHAVVDSVNVSQADINSKVDNAIKYFTQQYGSTEKVLSVYEAKNIPELKANLGRVFKEKQLVQGEQRNIISNITVTPEETRLYFKALKDSNALPDFPAEAKIAQIVLYAESTKEENERIINKLTEIKKQIEDGASFSMKAVINSDDPSVTQNSGKLGVIKKDSPFIREFKEVAFSLEEGEVSYPFKTTFGYHIVQVNKIMGDSRDVSHILMHAEISDEKLKETEKELKKIKEEISSGKISFDEAVQKYSEDTDTKNSGGVIMSQLTGEPVHVLSNLQPALHARTYQLKKGELGTVFYDESRGGEKMYKMYFMKDRTETHKADLVNDYVKIKALALQKKQQESMEKWTKNKITDTYLKISDEYKKCKFKNNWNKQ